MGEFYVLWPVAHEGKHRGRKRHGVVLLPLHPGCRNCQRVALIVVLVQTFDFAPTRVREFTAPQRGEKQRPHQPDVTSGDVAGLARRLLPGP